MVMYKAYKFRLYPTDEQRILLNKTFGCQRFVYNYYLNDIKNNGYKNPFTCINDYTSSLKYSYEFLGEVDSTSIRKTLFHLEDNFKRHFNSNFGYPKYKSKYSKNSYMASAVYRKYKDKTYCNIEVDLENRTIKLPKLKEVKIRGYRKLKKINGRIINATISRETNGKYYVSVMHEIPEVKQIVPNTIVGIDLGIKKHLTLSDNTVYDNNKYIEKYEKRIKRVQRELSRKEKESNNYYKCMLDAITDTQLIWIDDNVVCERINRIYYDSKNPRIELHIYPVDYIGIFDNISQLENFESNCIGCSRYKRNCSILQKAKDGRVQEEIVDFTCLKYKPKKDED